MPGRPKKYVDANERLKAFRIRQKQKRIDDEQSRILELKHEEMLKREARAMCAKILRGFIKSQDAIEFQNNEKTLFVNPNDRSKILRYIYSEAIRLSNNN